MFAAVRIAVVAIVLSLATTAYARCNVSLTRKLGQVEFLWSQKSVMAGEVLESRVYVFLDYKGEVFQGGYVTTDVAIYTPRGIVGDRDWMDARQGYQPTGKVQNYLAQMSKICRLAYLDGIKRLGLSKRFQQSLSDKVQGEGL
jgi:hypothetical protein